MAMKDWYGNPWSDQHPPQLKILVDGLSISAYGVPLTTRHGLTYELRDMLEFMLEVMESKDEELLNSLSSLFYNSKANVCHIMLKLDYDDPNFMRLRQKVDDIASRTITQYVDITDCWAIGRELKEALEKNPDSIINIE